MKFLNQYLCIPSWLGIFQFDIFWVTLWVSQRVFSLYVLLRVLTLFPCWLSIRLFCYVVLVAIFYSKIVLFLCHPIVGMSMCILNLLNGRIFFFCRFGMCCFVFIVLSCLDIFFSFSSFAPTFWFISSCCIVCFTCCVSFFFSSQNFPVFFLCLYSNWWFFHKSLSDSKSSPGLFLVLQLILTLLLSGWSWSFLSFSHQL